MAALWYPRFSSIPGVVYETPAGVVPSRLPGYGQKPKIHRFAGMEPSLQWGNTSASPAMQRESGAEARRLSTEGLLIHLAEILELPGEPSDYHFAIQGVAGQLRSRTAASAALFGELERLCWLDVKLIQAAPAAVSIDAVADRQFVHIMTFDWLLQLYLNEGRLADAVQVADIAERFDQGGKAIASARDRFAAVCGEDCDL